MSYISKFGKFLLPLALTAGAYTASAQDELPAGQSWRRIYFLDFGGNSTDDPVYSGTPLKSFQGSTSIKHSQKVSLDTKYTIGKYADKNNSASWISMAGDHTYPDDPNRGYFLMLNCPDELNYPTDVMYEKELTSAICSGVTFKFEAFVCNMEAVCSASKGVNYVTLGIYDGSGNKLWENPATAIGSGSVTASGSMAWIPISGTFSVDPKTDLSSIKFKIYPILDSKAGATPEGYDFGLDDIAIYVAQPSIEFTSTEFLYQEPGTISASLSNSTFFSKLENVSYIWEYSPDNGTQTSWVKVGEGTYNTSNTFDYNIKSFDKGNMDGTGNGYYRLTIANSDVIGSITSDEEPVCAARGTFQINETKNKMKILLCDGESYVVDKTTITSKDFAKPVITPNNFEVSVEVILNKDSVAESTSICIGQEYPVNSGNIYEELGVYDLNSVVIHSIRKSINGNVCDSVTLSQKLEVTEGIWTVNPPEKVCQGSALLDGIIRTKVGEFKDTVDLGCIHNVNVVVVNPVYDLVLDSTICEGSMYDGKKYSEGGIYTLPAKTYQSVDHCDSVVTMTLHVVSHLEEVLPDVELCQSDFGEDKPAFTFDGKKYTNTGKKDMVLDLEETSISNVTGCDSITKVHVVIHPMVHVENDTLICRDQKLFGMVWSVAGNYDHDFHYESANGCDSIVTWHIKVLDIQLKLRAEENRTSVCSGNSSTLIVDLVPSNVPLTWEPELSSTNPLRPVVLPEETTVYTAHARNSAGCHATDTITIAVNPNPTLNIDTVIVKERKLEANYFGGTPDYQFFLLNSQGKLIGERTMTEDNTIENLQRGSYILRLLDANGCVSDAPFSLEATPIYPAIMFSPNGDGINDVWQIVGIESYNGVTGMDNGDEPADPNEKPARVYTSYVRIFDRTGRLVYETRGYNNADNAFTGEYNGHLLPSTDYWYIIDLEVNDTQYVGHFTLLR